MKTFDSKSGIALADAVITVIQDNKQYLSDIDGLIGDGDHGINMNKGATLCRQALDANPAADAAAAFALISRTLMMRIGGSMGPLYGQFFKGFSEAFKGKDTLGAEDLKAALEGAVSYIQAISPATVGDKTLMDTLIPARDAYAKALSEGQSFEDSIHAMQAAAKAGAESTKDMVAKLGRSSKLGERSRGVQDAGATSCYLILDAIGNAILRLTE